MACGAGGVSRALTSRLGLGLAGLGIRVRENSEQNPPIHKRMRLSPGWG